MWSLYLGNHIALSLINSSTQAGDSIQEWVHEQDAEEGRRPLCLDLTGGLINVVLMG